MCMSYSLKWKVSVDKIVSPFPPGYFPRRFHYKKDAKERAEEAKRAGCTNVRVEKVEKV